MIGELVHDYALGRFGIVIGGAWIEHRDPQDIMSREIPWEWEVLYDDGVMMGAETMDLIVVNEGCIRK